MVIYIAKLLLEEDGHGFVDLATSLVEGVSLPLDLAAVGSIKLEISDTGSTRKAASG